MHALALIALLACEEGPLPDDTTPWTPADASCPVEVPDAPAIGADDWIDAEPPLGGDVIHFEGSAANPERIYAGSGQNGIYRSDDGGFTWETLPVGIAHLYGQLAVSSDDADCVAFSAGQPYVSDNGGQNFRPVELDGHIPDLVGLAFVGRRLLLVSTTGDVFAADDCGQQMEALGTVALYTAPPSAGHDLGQMSSRVWLAPGDVTVYALDDAGVLHKSDDGGVEWSATAVDASWVNHTFRIANGEQWVVRQGSGTYEVQYRDLFWDPEASFETVATVTGTATNAFLTPEGEYLVSGSGGIWSSVRGEIAFGLDDEGRGVYAVGRVGTSLLAGYRSGVGVSPDDGASWGWTSEEMTDLDIINLRVHPTCPHVLFAGTQCRSGTYRSEDHGRTWSRVSAAMHYTMGVDMVPAAPEHVWAVTDNLLYLSTDLGLTWENRYPKGDGVEGAHYHGLGVSPHRPSTVLVGSVGSGEYGDDRAHIYRTENHGATWSDASTGLPVTEESFHAVHWLAEVPGTVLLGTYRGGGMAHGGEDPGVGAYRSTDAGLTWSAITGTAAMTWAHFAECDGVVYAATELGVLATRDAGDTWDVLLEPGEGGEMENVACAGSRLLAVDSSTGVFRSADGGATWEDWTGSITFDLLAWENQLGLELSPDGSLAYFTHPGQGIKIRAWE